MDTSGYLPMFLAECREHLQELNLAVVRIEETPDDRATVDEIFRIAHSIKGMSATMGFAEMAALTHAMEDVFELFRQRSGGLEREAVDVLLECLDGLSAAVESIDTNGDEQLEAGSLIARLKGLVRAEPDPAPPAEERPLPAEGPIFEVAVRLAEGVLMPGVRAYQALVAVADHGQVVRSEPREDAFEGFDGAEARFWVVTDHMEEAVHASLLAVPDVAEVSVVEIRVPATGEACPPGTVEPGAVPEEATEPAERAAPASKGKGAATVRVDAERLDQLMHLTGELVVHRTRVESLAAAADVPGLPQAMQDLARSSQALQAMVMQVRMIPVEVVFLRFPRLVRDLSAQLGKQVELVLTGKETELDRTVVDALGDPIVHLVRNALDHGLERPEERRAAGKPEAATLEISARHAGGNVVISVRDDGRGIDPERVAQKAVERGLIPADAAAGVDLRDAIELLFAPGFSTVEQTSDISGRGVGMDAVRTTVRELGGEVLLETEPGAGTTAQIRLPLTLAIMAALLVEAGGLPLALPLERVERTLRLGEHAVGSVAGRPMLVLRDGVLPLFCATRSLGYDRGGGTEHAVIVRSGDERFALAVGALVGQRELVTRPLPPELGGRPGLSGGAVLANGEIALIVDCDALRATGRPPALPIAA